MYERNIRSWLKHLDFILLDLISIALSFAIAYIIRNGNRGLLEDASYRSFFLVFVGFHILIAFFFRSYSNVIRRGYLEEVMEISKQNMILIICISVYLVFTKQSEDYSRLFLGYFCVSNELIMILLRCIWKRIVRSKLNKPDNQSQLLVISTASQAAACIAGLQKDRYQPFHIAGMVLMDAPGGSSSIGGVPIVADADGLMEYVRLHVVDQVLIQAGQATDTIRALADQFLDMGVVVHLGLEQPLETLPHKQIHRLGSWTVISTSIQAASMMELFLKRVMDICGALVGLVITGIAFIFVAPVIYVKSPGPIFFSQNRMGKNGRKFKIYKFRSMYMDAEERKKELMEQNKMQGLMFKMDDDPRIIKGIGHFIRNTSIDELPQFWNILKGDMSLVGTRPPTVDEFEQYELHHKVRLSFRPGLTGLWQVSGRSDITDFEEVVRLDETYIAEWSILLDIKILLKTIKVVLKRQGSE
ncbi:MAG TPA: sugar transferase [Lachnospiraceae bacterium]|nr:sugar transferase [Lachnospiraceae bacterium]